MTTPEKQDAMPPLGLPYGSIRAIMTLMIVAVVISQIIRGVEVQVLWTETLMIALAHYFTSRRFINLPKEVIQQLSRDGHVELETKPLWLPKHTIRAVLVLAFVGVAAFLFHEGRLLDLKAVSILGVVFMYFLGIMLPFRDNRRWSNIKATAILLLMSLVTVAFLMDHGDMVPRIMNNATLGMVLFYFGSR